MAVLFGYQFVFTAILTVLLQKLSPIFSPGLNMITGFYRFVVPSDDDLKPFVSNKNSKDMRIPNDSGLQLNMHQTSRNHVAFLPFFNDFTWLIDFSLVAVVCFIGTEAYFQLGFNPSAVLHMGLIWVLVVFYLTVSILISMTKQYIQSKSGEMSVIMTCTSLALVASMICLISDKHMDFGLNESFQTFDLHLKKFYSEAFTDGKAPSGDSVQSYRGPSSMIFNGWLAITSTVLAGLLTFPGLKAAQMFSLLFKKERTLDQGIAVVNFATPFIVVLMYLKPVKYFYLDPNYFTLKNDDQAGSSSSTSMEELIATKEGSFKLFRALVILSLCAIKFITFKFYLQEYLISPKKELDEIRKDVGYTKTSKIQEEVKKVNLSTCITACQYMIPTVVVGFLCLFLVGSSDVRVLPSFEGKSDSLIGQLRVFLEVFVMDTFAAHPYRDDHHM